MKNTIKLIELITKSKELPDFAWLRTLDLDAISFEIRQKDRMIPLERTKNIYFMRARINEASGNKIKGFEGLVNRLNTTHCNNVLIHKMVDSKGREFMAFTDQDLIELLGILEFPNDEN